MRWMRGDQNRSVPAVSAAPVVLTAGQLVQGSCLFYSTGDKASVCPRRLTVAPITLG
jgi:hypothetical protein